MTAEGKSPDASEGKSQASSNCRREVIRRPPRVSEGKHLLRYLHTKGGISTDLDEGWVAGVRRCRRARDFLSASLTLPGIALVGVSRIGNLTVRRRAYPPDASLIRLPVGLFSRHPAITHTSTHKNRWLSPRPGRIFGIGSRSVSLPDPTLSDVGTKPAANATPAAAKRTGRARVSNGSALFLDETEIDGRSTLARRYRDVLSALVSDLGGDPSEAQAIIARRAATLAVWCEQSESVMAAGQPIDIGAFTTATNALRRLLADLGLERRMKDITGATLRDRLMRDRGPGEPAAAAPVAAA